MKKADIRTLVGLVLMLIALVYLGFNAYSFTEYKFSHPQLTETELQVRALGKFTLLDALIILGGAAGAGLVYYESAQKRY